MNILHFKFFLSENKHVYIYVWTTFQEATFPLMSRENPPQIDASCGFSNTTFETAKFGGREYPFLNTIWPNFVYVFRRVKQTKGTLTLLQHKIWTNMML